MVSKLSPSSEMMHPDFITGNPFISSFPTQSYHLYQQPYTPSPYVYQYQNTPPPHVNHPYNPLPENTLHTPPLFHYVLPPPPPLPRLYTPPFTLTCHNTLSTGQPFYAVETITSMNFIAATNEVGTVVAGFQQTVTHQVFDESSETLTSTSDETPEPVTRTINDFWQGIDDRLNQIIQSLEKREKRLTELLVPVKALETSPNLINESIPGEEVDADIGEVEKETRVEDDNVFVLGGNEGFKGSGDAGDEKDEVEGEGEVDNVDENAANRCLFGYALKVFDEIPKRIIIHEAPLLMPQGMNHIIYSLYPYNCGDKVKVYKLHENEYGKFKFKDMLGNELGLDELMSTKLINSCTNFKSIRGTQVFDELLVINELLRAFLNCDLVGFYTFYARQFLSCCSRLLGLDYQSKGEYIELEYYGRTVSVKILRVGSMDQIESVKSLAKTRNKGKDKDAGVMTLFGSGDIGGGKFTAVSVAISRGEGINKDILKKYASTAMLDNLGSIGEVVIAKRSSRDLSPLGWVMTLLGPIPGRNPITWVRSRFKDYFSNLLKLLDSTYLTDSSASTDAPKRFPQLLQFTTSVPNYLHSVMATSILCSKTFGNSIHVKRSELAIENPTASNWLGFLASSGIFTDDWADEAIMQSGSQSEGPADGFVFYGSHRGASHNLHGFGPFGYWEAAYFSGSGCSSSTACGGMSTGLCLGAELSSIKIVTNWAVDYQKSACDSFKLNHRETQVKNMPAEDYLELLKGWEKLCNLYALAENRSSKSSLPGHSQLSQEKSFTSKNAVNHQQEDITCLNAEVCNLVRIVGCHEDALYLVYFSKEPSFADTISFALADCIRVTKGTHHDHISRLHNNSKILFEAIRELGSFPFITVYNILINLFEEEVETTAKSHLVAMLGVGKAAKSMDEINVTVDLNLGEAAGQNSMPPRSLIKYFARLVNPNWKFDDDWKETDEFKLWYTSSLPMVSAVKQNGSIGWYWSAITLVFDPGILDARKCLQIGFILEDKDVLKRWKMLQMELAEVIWLENMIGPLNSWARARQITLRPNSKVQLHDSKWINVMLP